MTSARSPQHDLERELREMNAPTPPADLVAKIQLEIPSSDELVRAAAGAATKPHRSIPWLRLAATLAIAGLAGTVAWQTLRDREALAPVEEPAERALEDVGRRSTPAAIPPPPPATLKVEARPAEKLPVMGRERSDLAQDEAKSPSSSSFSRRELDTVASAEAGAVVQRAAVPESVPAAPKPQLAKDKSRDAEIGVVGSVEGGVPGGVTGGTGAPAAAAAPATSTSPSAESFLDRAKAAGRYSVAYDSLQLDNPRGNEAAPAKESERRGAQPDTMIFRDAGVNRFVITADDRLSTFALDVDTGSYTLARSYLERGVMPPPEAIRLEEFVNAMSYSDAAPRREDFALYAEGSESPSPDATGLSLLRFAVKAREVADSDRKPANLTFVVDVSGSMNREDRLGLVKRALGLLLDELTRDDRVALVVYGTQGRVLLRPTYDHAAIRDAIARLVPDGSTNAEEGLRLGYDLADEAWVKGAINRIILCSDGVANVGATGPESILHRIGEQARRGIQLTTIGFGMGNYNDALMERLANQGDGSYHYVDQLDEARRVFVENLTGTLQHVAKDAKVQVEFDPRTVERWRLLGYENRDVADRDFRNDAVDAGEVGAGQAATALYEVRLRSGVRPGDRVARLNVRWKSVDGRPAGEVRELARELRVADIGRRIDRAPRDLRLAAIAAAFAEKLKGTRAGDAMRWSELAADADDLVSDLPRDSEARSVAELIDRAARLAGERGRHRREAEPESERENDAGDRGNGRLDEPR